MTKVKRWQRDLYYNDRGKAEARVRMLKRWGYRAKIVKVPHYRAWWTYKKR